MTTTAAQPAREETLEELDARLRRKYDVVNVRELDAVEYARRVALLTAPPRRPIVTFDAHVRDMTPAQYRDALKRLGIHRDR